MGFVKLLLAASWLCGGFLLCPLASGHGDARGLPGRLGRRHVFPELGWEPGCASAELRAAFLGTGISSGS